MKLKLTTITDSAKRHGVPTSKLRFWLKANKVTPVATFGNVDVYDLGVVETLLKHKRHVRR